MKIFFIYVHILGLSLIGCSSEYVGDSGQTNIVSETIVDKQASELSAKHPPIAEDLYRELAPPDWKMNDTRSRSASFLVRTEYDEEREGRLIKGAIVLDGRFESLTNPFRFRAFVLREGKEKYANVALNYPDVDGFEKAVVSPRRGYSTKLDTELRELLYVNREHGIFCQAYYPGRTRCFWGDEIVRYGLDFDSQDTLEALSYLSSICFHRTGCPTRRDFRNDLPQVNEETYRDLAPPSWHLDISTGGAAAFTVKTERVDGLQGKVFDGTIALDGRFARVESPLYESFGSSENPWRSWPAFYKYIQTYGKRHADAASKYADVEGFDKAVISLEGGYHDRSGKESHIVVYFNRDQGIYCRSHNPGKARCFWGNEDVRYGLNFNSNDTVEALNYLTSLLNEEGNS